MWNKRWLILRHAPTGKVRIEKYENEVSATGSHPSAHLAFYDLDEAQIIDRSKDPSKPGVHIILSDLSTLQFATDTSKSGKIHSN